MEPTPPTPRRKLALAAAAVLIAFVIVAALRLRAPGRPETATELPAPAATVAAHARNESVVAKGSGGSPAPRITEPQAGPGRPESETAPPSGPPNASPAHRQVLAQVLGMIESRNVNGKEFDEALARLTSADAKPLAARYWKTPSARYEQRAALVLALSRTRAPEARRTLVDVLTADLSGRGDLSTPELERYDAGERDMFVSSMLLPETLALRKLAAEAREDPAARTEVSAGIRKALAQNPPEPLRRRLDEELRSLEGAQMVE